MKGQEEFKKGDQVEVISNKHNHHYCEIGDKGIVINTEYGSCLVDIEGIYYQDIYTEDLKLIK